MYIFLGKSRGDCNVLDIYSFSLLYSCWDMNVAMYDIASFPYHVFPAYVLSDELSAPDANRCSTLITNKLQVTIVVINNPNNKGLFTCRNR